MAYAANTDVPQDRSEAEIKRLILRHGAEEYATGHGKGRATIGFRMSSRIVRFELPLPKLESFAVTPRGRRRSIGATEEAFHQETRRCWRALALIIKAKLEAVETGVTTFEQEFLAHIVMPDGKTVGQHVGATIESAYAAGKVQPLLPEFTS